jgi:hypothetical protein
MRAILGVVGVVILGTTATLAAPAPLPHPPKKPVLVKDLVHSHYHGDWIMVWGKGEWDTTLSPFGTYICSQPKGSVWIGNWWINERNRFTVRESWVDENGLRGSLMQWEVEWTKEDGKLNLSRLSGNVYRQDGSVWTTIVLRRPSKSLFRGKK